MKALALATLAACANPSPLDPPPPVGSPPRATMPIAIDGAADEPDWDHRALRGDFEPGTEIRLLRAEHLVFVFVDVRDRDIASADRVDLQLGTVVLGITPATAATPTIGRAITGTVDDPIDEDVGWRFELAIPIDSLGPRPTQLRATRCDAASHPESDRTPPCGGWSTTLEPTLPP